VNSVILSVLFSVREFDLCTLILKTQQIDVANVCSDAVTPFCNLNHKINMAKKKVKKIKKVKKVKKPKKAKKKTTSTGLKRGRPLGSGRYGCDTTAVRVPKQLIDEVRKFISKKVKAGAKTVKTES
jgi:hypothetical protein